MKKCAIYTRVSTNMQAEKEFNSCEAQELKIKNFVKSQNKWEVVKVYSDPGFTGANIKRPAFQEMLEDIKQRQIDIILCYKIDRLTRSPRDFYQLIELFDKYTVDFISVTERFDTSTPSGRLLRNIMLTFAQFERELTSERVKDKMFQRAQKGMWNGGSIPFGYSNQDKRLIVDKQEAKIVKSMYDVYIETGSLCRVYSKLKNKTIRTRKGKIFTKKALSDILRNNIYTGKIKHNGKIFEGIHKPIISDNVFDIAQKIHKKKIKKYNVYRNHLFAGLIRCKECDYMMTPCFTNKKKDGKLKRYFYYRCLNVQMRDWDSCSTKEVNADRLEEFITENLQRIIRDNSYIENMVFRLNHKEQAGSREGFELPDAGSAFSASGVKKSIKNVLDVIAQNGRTERNIGLKKNFGGIFYSPSEVEVEIKYFPAEEHNNLKDLLFSGQKRAFSDGEQAKPPVLPGSKTGSFDENFLTGLQIPAKAGQAGSAIEEKVKTRQKIKSLFENNNGFSGKNKDIAVQSKSNGGATHINANSFIITLPNTIHKCRQKLKRR